MSATSRAVPSVGSGGAQEKLVALPPSRLKYKQKSRIKFKRWIKMESSPAVAPPSHVAQNSFTG